MAKTMQAFYVEADWDPRPGYPVARREREDRRAYRADMVYRNVRTGLRDIPLPEAGPDEVLIRVGACGVCGSDIHTLGTDADGYSVYPAHLRLPVVTGHEYSGEVVAVGSDVTTVRQGDLIAVEQIRWCGRCRQCRTGMFNQCERLEEAGLSCDGGFAEYALVPEKYCCVINSLADSLGDPMAALEAGALAEPACVAYAGMQVNAGGVKPGANVVVFGAGPIGLAAIALARASGAGKILSFNTNPARSGLAAALGADRVFETRQPGEAGRLVLEETDGLGAGMIVEASGNFPAVYPEIMHCLGAGATVVQLGNGARPAVLDFMPLVRKNARIIGSMGHAGSDIFPSVLRMMAAGRLDLRPMVTGRYPLARAEEALADAARRERGHGKVLISARYGAA